MFKCESGQSLLTNVVVWLKKHISKKTFNSFSIIIIMFYYYVGLLSYITVPIQPLYRLFISGSSVAVLFRALTTAVVCLYSLLLLFVNKEKIRWGWVMVFIYIIIFTLISTFISPQTYNYIYVSQSNYWVVYWVQASTGWKRLFTMFLSSISDFALAFCFLFALPVVFNNKKQMLLLSIPIVIIAILECIYSIVVEKSEYIKLINFTDPQYGGYNINIGATFGNKQDWGAFLTIAFTCSVASLFFIDINGWKWFVIKVLVLVSSIIIFIFSCASLCKTAIFSELVIYLFVALYLVYYLFKMNILVALLYLAVFISFIAGLVCFFIIPAFHADGTILGKIYNVLYNYVIEKIINGAMSGRSNIWTRFINNLRTYNMFFGLSKGGVSTYSMTVTVEGDSLLHNGFIYFLGSYGILGFSIYLVLFSLVIKNIISVWKIKPSYVFLLLGSLVACLIFSLVEAEVLIVSGSNPVFIFNILLCVFPAGLLYKQKKESSYEIVKQS